ncbi:MAG: tyrosine-type recombinase/integrase, partial [Gammaproteobacteria bacterium]
KLAGEKGLYLLVKLAGKYWRFDYRFGGKRKTLALGVYPDVSLKAARDARDDARKQIAAGIDPADNRKATKAAKRGDDPNSFEVITREWVEKYRKTWTPNHITKVVRFFEQDVFPWIGKRSVNVIAAVEILLMLRRIESRGANEIAHRIKQNCGRVFHYAIATGRAERNPVADLQGALEPLKVKHHAAITEPKAVGALLRAIEGYQGSFVTHCALGIAPLVFVRPGELRAAEWTEFELDAAEWRIPAERMKMRSQHIVPLSTQAVAILRELHPLTSTGRYVFPSVRTNTRPMSENTVNGALRRLGYAKDEMTGHGFRSLASTLLNEQGWHRDAIERQLAHAERDAVRAAYNYAEHLPERRRMMQAWGDYLDGLKNGAEVVALRGQVA